MAGIIQIDDILMVLEDREGSTQPTLHPSTPTCHLYYYTTYPSLHKEAGMPSMER